ncbi:MAG TPA: bifunctional 4-hydroxy-2-oxoglutarate aldolase/2-dehydro-3-deoxy-phosphogluconate aldolase [Polyangia bacterium]|nr:bifunctional 4-hydroxy-2-oxoglutarate aldolase/2-dehydro-3-deoxy-phosphogluconate aldolase [Polyangia bacterium]
MSDTSPAQATLFDALRAHRLAPVVAIRDADAATGLAQALVAGGLPLIEITLRTEAAPAALKRASAVSGLAIAAGTVTTPDQVKLAVDAGARMIISPGLNTRVVEYCLAQNIPVVPGVCTPTEIETARNYGLKTLKFFPAEAYGGVKTLKALGEVYKDFNFVPTGGVNLQNLGDYLKLPIVMACGGSWMVPAAAIDARRFDEIEGLVRDAVRLVKSLGAA